MKNGARETGQRVPKNGARGTEQSTPKQGGRAAKNGARIFIALCLVCVFLPLIIMVVWAFTERWSWPSLLPEVISTRGIGEIFSSSSQLGLTLLFSIALSLVVAIISTVIAAMAAQALCHYSFKGKTLWRIGTILPFLIPSTVFAMGIQVAFIRLGLSGSFFGVVIAHTVITLPYSILLLLDITKAAGTKLVEQAKTLGANPWQVLVHVQIPQLLPGLLSSFSMAYILSFSQYFLTLLIGGGNVKTFAMVMFPYLVSGDRTIAAAYGAVFLFVSLVVFVVFELLLKRYTSKTVDYYS